jgi:hypothetical protein
MQQTSKAGFLRDGYFSFSSAQAIWKGLLLFFQLSGPIIFHA